MTAQHAMERKMLYITLHDKVKNSLSKTKVKDILEKLKEAKWRWAGHVARRVSDRMATKNREEKERKTEEKMERRHYHLHWHNLGPGGGPLEWQEGVSGSSMDSQKKP